MARPQPPQLSPTQMYMLRMNDGRAFTDYSPYGPMPQRSTDTAMRSNDLKNMLIRNAEQSMQSDRAAAAQSVGASLTAPAQLADIPGFVVTQFCDSRSCSFASIDSPGGLGIDTKAAPPPPLP